MKLKELLAVYQAYAELELKDENHKLIDTCKNGNLIKNLYGDRKVETFLPKDNYITVILKNKE